MQLDKIELRRPREWGACWLGYTLVFPVPLQIEKVFNGEDYPASENDWRNLVVFGDNLQFLKTVYENRDSLIKNKRSCSW